MSQQCLATYYTAYAYITSCQAGVCDTFEGFTDPSCSVTKLDIFLLNVAMWHSRTVVSFQY